MDGEILEAVAAEAPAMTELLAELVAARTLLGDEAAGQAVMRRAFAEIGLKPFEVPLDGAALERHPGRRALRLGRRRQGERARGLASRPATRTAAR